MGTFLYDPKRLYYGLFSSGILCIFTGPKV
ncbi:hypothetical protein Gotri_015923 [Gossypium trilobum]|uniref:Uncharacterized protein n=1 Tax=Gossypium trilobum TaxID=34281 RepID=A0A7J9E1R0_9ROSI|nr:hypothetical protein [Gossypium trilobum]